MFVDEADRALKAALRLLASGPEVQEREIDRLAVVRAELRRGVEPTPYDRDQERAVARLPSGGPVAVDELDLVLGSHLDDDRFWTVAGLRWDPDWRRIRSLASQALVAWDAARSTGAC